VRIAHINVNIRQNDRFMSEAFGERLGREAIEIDRNVEGPTEIA
jgi:hypothetical protein